MTFHDAKLAVLIGGDINHALLRGVLVKRMTYVLSADDDPQQLLETDPDTGAVILTIRYLGRDFDLDPDDATTPHDGVVCLVTLGGKRYKLAGSDGIVAYSVFSRLDAPPYESWIGDAYLVKPAATGDFAGHDNQVALYTARGWEFIEFGIGRLIYVEDEDAYYRLTAGGSWSRGLGFGSIEDDSLPPSALIGGAGKVLWIVENQTTTAPPAVVNGVAYIIGAAATGAWAGHDTKIAHGEGGAWVIYNPPTGAVAYDKALGTPYQRSGSGWVSATGRLNITPQIYLATGNWAKPARLAYVIVHVVGGGGLLSASSGGAATSGGTTSFGSHVSATGGQGGNSPGFTGGAGGTGSGGDINITGSTGASAAAPSYLPGGRAAGLIGFRGAGQDTFGGTDVQTGGGGGYAQKRIEAAALAANETVTISTATGQRGYCYVEEYIYA